MESLSSYARQFLGRMHKPDFDYIKGLPPAIAVEQKVNTRNPRSTVGTSTEIYDYLRMLYARIGHTYSPVSGLEVKRHTSEDIQKCISSFSAGTKFVILSKLHTDAGKTLERQLQVYLQQGFSRIYHNGTFIRIEDAIADISQFGNDDIYILIDRLSVDSSSDTVSRINDSVETAFFEGNGSCRLVFIPSNITYVFSDKFEADGMHFEESNDNMFSFNSPIAACPVFEGFGNVIGIDEKLVIPNPSLSVYAGCLQCWHAEKME